MEAVTVVSMAMAACGDGGGHQPERCYRNEMSAAATAQLKKILEWELSLDARDLRSHAWYHGCISRAKAEQIVGERDGDFLVRDCTSQPGNYVLSCRSKGQHLHFVINKMVLQADTVYESVQYRFEDDGFDTVPDLITYYVGSGKPITVSSAAKIQNPRNRRHPLCFYDAQCFETRSRTTTTTTTTTTSESAVAVSKSPTARRRNSSAISGSVKQQRSLSLRSGDVVFAAGSVKKPPPPLPSSEKPRMKNNDRRDWNSSDDGDSFGNSLPRSSSCMETASRSFTTSPSVKAVVCGRDPGFSADTYVNAKVVVVDDDDHDDHHRDGGDGGCSPSPCTDYANGYGIVTEPPPKPSRRIAVREHLDPAPATQATSTPHKHVLLYAAASSTDSGNGSDDSARSCDVVVAAADARKTTSGVVIKTPKYDDDDDKREEEEDEEEEEKEEKKKKKKDDGDNEDDRADSSSISSSSRGRSRHRVTPNDYDVLTGSGSPATLCSNDENDISYGVIRMNVHRPPSVSAFDLEAFHTLLLPTIENKPLDTCALQGLHMLLMDSGSRILANHLTRVDLELTLRDFTDGRHACDGDCGSGSSYHTIGCKNGIELSFLPQGRRHRYDLIERSECLRLLVAVTVLTCATESERAELLNKWIQVAIDTKTALGNLYGFCGIMLGLCTPQVLRLNETWHILRQRYTDSAFNFEAKLRPTLKCMNESTNPLAPNTTIPHLLPVILLHEANYPRISGNCGRGQQLDDDDDDDDDDMYRAFVTNSHLWDVCINQWESCSPDLGLGTSYSHLNATRQFYNLLPTFRRNAEIVLTDSKIDHLLFDMFRTEFHMKFLWGSRGAKVNASERYSKFQQVLNVMSEKCETIDYDNDDDDDNDDSVGSGANADAAFASSRSADWYNSSATVAASD